VKTGNGFVIHASRVFDSGELWARVGPGCFSTCASLQNLTLQYFVVLRERGAIYYASGLAGAHGVGSYPNMRPIAIDSFNEDREVHAGVHQAVLGEIGFTMDTRVHGVRVAELGADFGTAHAADSLRGVGPLDASTAEEGGLWRAVGLERTGEGARGRGVEARATLETGRASGLIHALIEPTEDSRPTGLTFRVQDTRNLWAVVAGPGGCSVRLCEDGKWMTVAEDPTSLQPGREASLQVVDHGSEFTVGINGAMAFGRRFVDGRLREATGVGLWSSGAGESALIRDFEAHPREVSIPQALDQGPPWSAEGSRILVRDCFAGAQGELAGRVTTAGNKTWRHDLGEGRFEVTGDGAARVHASIGVPSPGRTIYTIDWDDPELADIDVEMTPPGTRRGENHRGRGGMVFWQDRLNYFMINLWLHDNLDTASISTFFCINGFDDLYDAIWTCTGPNRTKWGVPFRFRSVFDGDHFLVRIDGEPVLQRRLTDVYPRQRPMKITRIGLFTNWEWGTDTGTIFRDLVARGR